MNAPESPGSSPRTLALVRVALLIGVLIFGAIAWFLTRHGGLAVLDPPVLERFRFVLSVVLIVVAIGLLTLRRRHRAHLSFQKKAMYSIIGWAGAEAAALAGGTYFMVTGHVRYYLIGLLMMLVSAFVLLPVPGREQ